MTDIMKITYHPMMILILTMCLTLMLISYSHINTDHYKAKVLLINILIFPLNILYIITRLYFFIHFDKDILEDPIGNKISTCIIAYSIVVNIIATFNFIPFTHKNCYDYDFLLCSVIRICSIMGIIKMVIFGIILISLPGYGLAMFKSVNENNDNKKKNACKVVKMNKKKGYTRFDEQNVYI